MNVRKITKIMLLASLMTTSLALKAMEPSDRVNSFDGIFNEEEQDTDAFLASLGGSDGAGHGSALRGMLGSESPDIFAAPSAGDLDGDGTAARFFPAQAAPTHDKLEHDMATSFFKGAALAQSFPWSALPPAVVREKPKKPKSGKSKRPGAKAFAAPVPVVGEGSSGDENQVRPTARRRTCSSPVLAEAALGVAAPLEARFTAVAVHDPREIVPKAGEPSKPFHKRWVTGRLRTHDGNGVTPILYLKKDEDLFESDLAFLKMMRKELQEADEFEVFFPDGKVFYK
jgi:hypothetical protein